jgi:RNA polymerase sigma-70 factor (ECF subfamily)
MDQADDRDVISSVLAGDTDAYAVLVERYQRPIFNLMLRMAGSREDAADLAQETFIKAFDQLHRFKEGKKFFPWLYTIGLNHSKNFLRSKRTELIPIEDVDSESGLDYPGRQEDDLCARIDLKRLGRALDLLPLDHREAVVLRYHEELSVEEVAQALGITAGNARVRIFRGLKKLREILERDGHGRKEQGPAPLGVGLGLGCRH